MLAQEDNGSNAEVRSGVGRGRHDGSRVSHAFVPAPRLQQYACRGPMRWMIHQYGFGPLRRAIPIAAGELSEGRIGAGHHVGRPQRMRLPCAKPIAEREGLTERRVARLIDIASCRRILVEDILASRQPVDMPAETPTRWPLPWHGWTRSIAANRNR